MFNAETKIRVWAECYQNSYILCIFACDRTVYEIGRNFGNVKGFEYFQYVEKKDKIDGKTGTD